ncbi:long-chain fatty acid-CoA ligase, partial [Podochytrium sp. JEL0797]
MLRSVALPNTATSSSGAIRHHAAFPDTLTTTPEHSVATVYDVMMKGYKAYPTKHIMGSRKQVRVVKEEKDVKKTNPDGSTTTAKKVWNYFELAPFDWLSFQDVHDITHLNGCGLRALGLKPKDKVTIFADTSRDWMLMALSASTQNLTITTAYPTLGEEGLAHSLNECEVTTIFTNAELLPMILKIASKVKTLKNVLHNGTLDPEMAKKLKDLNAGLKLVSLVELQALGKANPVEPVAPTPDDLCCIMYTSGSTGPPKGVMLTHGNVVGAISGAKTLMDPLIVITDPREAYLAYLPLSHILEFVVELTAIYYGVKVGYGNVKTLTDASVRNCKGDLRELSPTFLCGVPQVWEGIRKVVMDKLQSAPTLVKTVFDYAFWIKWHLMCWGLSFLAYPLDVLIFSKIKDQVGGRLKFAISGGAPIPRATHQFMNVAADFALVNGYGMTECCAVASIQSPLQNTTFGILGEPVSCLEMKLVDVPEMNYRSTNVPKPQGEVWMRGASVMKGYYKQPKLTQEALTEDGWLMSGDIGEWNANGTLSIIDRKKNLVKLSNGEL